MISLGKLAGRRHLRTGRLVFWRDRGCDLLAVWLPCRAEILGWRVLPLHRM